MIAEDDNNIFNEDVMVKNAGDLFLGQAAISSTNDEFNVENEDILKIN